MLSITLVIYVVSSVIIVETVVYEQVEALNG